MQRHTVYLYLETALHVSGIIITHLQEHKTTLTTASGNRYTGIDRANFLLLKSTYRLELLMMSGVPLETCRALK
jgi:hypothetical protein